MCCLFSTIILLGPRIALALWWLFRPLRFAAVFNGFLLPLLGIIFLPWTTLMYVFLWKPVVGIAGLDWLWLALALVIDLTSYGGGAYSNRERLAH